MLGNDLVSSLQSLVKTYNPPLIEVSDTLPDAPKFMPGEKVQAHVLAYLPNGRFQVEIKDQILDLNLPKNTQPGDQVDLEVVESKGKLVLTFPQTTAKPETLPDDTPSASQQVSLSPQGKLLSSLLSDTSQQSMAKVQGQPLNPVLTGEHLEKLDTGNLSQQLQSKVETSGLFYESHQKEWVSGERSLQTLKQEPQAMLGRQAEAMPDSSSTTMREGVSASLNATALQNTSPDTQATTKPGVDSNQQLQQMVKQQLQVLDNRQFVWQGEVWRHQDMEWMVKEDGGQTGDENERSWYSQLKINLPTLGEMTIAVSLTGNQVGVNFVTPNTETISKINQERGRLQLQMEAAGLQLSQAQARSEQAIPDEDS